MLPASSSWQGQVLPYSFYLSYMVLHNALCMLHNTGYIEVLNTTVRTILIRKRFCNRWSLPGLMAKISVMTDESLSLSQGRSIGHIHIVLVFNCNCLSWYWFRDTITYFPKFTCKEVVIFEPGLWSTSSSGNAYHAVHACTSLLTMQCQVVKCKSAHEIWSTVSSHGSATKDESRDTLRRVHGIFSVNCVN